MSDLPVLNTSRLSIQQAQFVNEYCIDFNARAACKRIGVNEQYGQRFLQDNDVQKAIYDIIGDKFKHNQLLITEALKEAQQLASSDIADFVDWDENTVTIKPKSETKNTRAIKSIKQGRFGVEITLHDKVSALNLMFQTLGLLKKAADAQNPLENVAKTIDAEVSGSESTSLREALLEAERTRQFLPLRTNNKMSVFDSATEEQPQSILDLNKAVENGSDSV